jgi:hypothetical protein
VSDFEDIASALRELAQDTSPVSADLQGTAQEMKTPMAEVEELSGLGIDLGPLLAVLQQAQAHAREAAHSAAQVKSQGMEWADHLA